MHLLSEHKVFDQIFSGSKYHAQIAQRASILIKFYAEEKKLGTPEIELLWATAQKEESAKLNIYKLISENGHVLESEVLEALVEKIDQMEPTVVTQRDLKFLFDLARKSFRNTKPKEAAFEVLWHIASLSKRGYAKEILEPSRTHLADLIRTAENSTKDLYAQKCCEIIGNHSDERSSLQAIIILHEIL